MTKSNGPNHSAVQSQASSNIGLFQLTAPEKGTAKQSVITAATAITSRGHSAVTSQTPNNIGLPQLLESENITSVTTSTLPAIRTSISHFSTHEPLPGHSATASRLPHKSSAPALITTESTPAELSTSASRSLTPSKSSVTPLASTESTCISPVCSLPAYRSVSPSPPAYTSRAYLTIDDLYMRYAPLQQSFRLVNPRFPHAYIPRFSTKIYPTPFI